MTRKYINNNLVTLTGKLSFLIRSKLWLQILVCMFLGVITGLLISPEGAAIIDKKSAELIAAWLVVPGHIFLSLIQMIMIPLIVSSVILGIAGTKSFNELKSMGMRIVPYFICTTIVAVTIGIILASVVKPGQYVDKALISNVDSGVVLRDVSPDESVELPTLQDGIIGLIPTNPLGAAINESMLQLVVLSILIGVALTIVKTSHSAPLIKLAKAIKELSLVIVGWAMLLVPLAVFGLLTQITMKVGIAALLGVSVYVVTVLAGLTLLLLFYLSLVYFIGGVKPAAFLFCIREVQLLAFSTSSSAAVMPLSLEVAEKKLNVRKSTTNFIIPLGATINMDGTAIYQVIAAIFLTQVFGVDLSSGELLLLVATTVGASIGTPGTPGVGIVILATLLTNIGVPTGGIALIIGVDRILDMSRTVINVTGDLTACIIVDKWLKKS
jgi:proton glutamate symport protein